MLRAMLEAVGLASDPRANGKRRSSQWPKVRAAHLKAHPECEVCGVRRNVTAHHVKPFHLYAELELDPANLMTLCEGPGVNCHLLVGHLNDWRAWNPHARIDAATWRTKIQDRETFRIAEPLPYPLDEEDS